jgi:hypothetical protein
LSSIENMATVTVHTAKTQLSNRRKQPKPGFGSMKGRATIGPEFWEPPPEEELKLWEGA